MHCCCLLCAGSRRRPTLKKSKNDLLNPDEGDGDLALGKTSAMKQFIQSFYSHLCVFVSDGVKTT